MSDAGNMASDALADYKMLHGKPNQGTMHTHMCQPAVVGMLVLPHEVRHVREIGYAAEHNFPLNVAIAAAPPIGNQLNDRRAWLHEHDVAQACSMCT